MSTKPMVFIETDSESSRPAGQTSAVLVLDRPPMSTAARCDGPARVPALTLCPPAPVTADQTPAPRTYGLDSVYRAPGLALMAAVSILEGYKWLGVIPVDRSLLANLVFGRVGAAVFAALILAAAVLVARPEGDRRRSPSQRLVLLAAGTVAAATVAFVFIHGSATARWLGGADLTLAAVVLGTLVAAERSRRRADRRGAVGSTTTASPLAGSRTPQ
jgi:hypothetical protein